MGGQRSLRCAGESGSYAHTQTGLTADGRQDSTQKVQIKVLDADHEFDRGPLFLVSLLYGSQQRQVYYFCVFEVKKAKVSTPSGEVIS